MILKFMKWCISILFIICGIILIIIGVNIFLSSTEFKKNATLEKATITNLETKIDLNKCVIYTVFVDYTVDGIKHNNRLDFYNFDMTVGKKVVIYYNPDSPNIIQASGRDIVGLIFSGVGILILVIEVIRIIIKFTKLVFQHLKILLKNGKKLVAIIEDVKLNTSHKINKKTPYIIICKVIDNVT